MAGKLQDADWAKIALAGRLTDEFKADVVKAFEDYEIHLATHKVSGSTIDLVTQIRGRLANLNDLLEKLERNREYKLAKSHPHLPSAKVEVLRQTTRQLALLDEEMHQAKLRLDGTREFDPITGSLAGFFESLLSIQAKCLKRPPPHSVAKSGNARKFIDVCANWADPSLTDRKINPAFESALKYHNDLRTADPENWEDYFVPNESL